MAIDQTPTPIITAEKPKAAIENEFPTYRAISSLAVFSLILGLGAVFCFANLWFLLLTGASTIIGWLALRRIRKLPEILTGASFARVGIGVGLLFGLTAVTHDVVQDIQSSIAASQFTKRYVEIIRDQPVSVAIFYMQSPEYREHKTVDEMVDEMKKSKSPTSPDPYGSKAGPFQRIKDRLKSQGQEIRYSQIEKKLIDGLTTYANALIEVDGPVTKEFPQKEYGFVGLVKNAGAGKNDWVVMDFKYPYTPASAGLQAIHKSDDGHGH